MLDKTGTITAGTPEMTDVIPADGVREEELLRFASTLESRSEHPLAKAVLSGAQSRGIEPGAIDGFTALPGSGVRAEIDGAEALGGSLKAVKGEHQYPRAARGESRGACRRGQDAAVLLPR